MARAQEQVQISFPRGTTGTTINGSIVGFGYTDYILRVSAGQRLNANLTVTSTNGNGSAFFNILPTGQDYGAIFVGSNEGRNASVTVPRSGDWTIRVYLMGNDRDTGKTVRFSLNVVVPPAGGGGSAGTPPPASGELYVVQLSTPGGLLNVRSAPSTSASVLGRFRDGTVVRDVGGCTTANGQRWCNVQPTQGGTRGWVSARFLGRYTAGGTTPPSQPPSTPDTGGTLVQVARVPAGDVLNMRSGPGTSYRIVGALSNGTTVRRYGCQNVGSATWCEIQMQTDMRERGWVNSRYLTEGTATNLPSAPGSSATSSGQLKCTNQPGLAMFDCNFTATRRGNGNATVQVTLPTGNTRTITFSNGKPTSVNASGALSYVRIGDLTVVILGNLERYRVPDAVVYGG